MKSVLFTIMLLLSYSVFSQATYPDAKTFVRIYDLQGKKIAKGKILKITDTHLELNQMKRTVEVPVENIGKIKTKRAAGNNILMGAAIVGVPMALLGAGSAEPDSWVMGYNAAEGIAGGAILGGALGAAAGGITVLFKNSKSYEIQGDPEKWNTFRDIILKE